MDADAQPSRKRRPLRRLLIAVGTVIAILAVVAVGAWIWKPWAPTITVAEPARSGEWVRADGVLGHWYPAADAQKGPAVLVVGGSEGGLGQGLVSQATALQSEGYSVLALSYFGAEGQPDALVDVPLETFDAGLNWLVEQPEVNPARIAMIGGSKGAEAALLMAARSNRFAAVVAYVPSHVVWQGIDLVRPWRMSTSPQSSWTDAGKPLPYAAFGTERTDTLAETYQAALDAGVPAAARIDVAAIEAPVLLTCGGRDTIWPSCRMAQELAAAGRDGQVTLLSYPDAGHLVQGPPVDIDPERDESGGGTAKANHEARADAWPRVVAFLREALG